jgi:hypothetical protein
VLADTLALIDAFLADTKHNSLIDGDRVRDALLDIRSSLTLTQETL